VTGTIRVAVVTRQRLVKEALAALFSKEAGIEVVDADVVHESRPNVVLVDMPTPGLEDLSLLRTLQHACPDAKLLLLTADPDEALMCRALASGARG
jgi:DNA-binding NarL/FixJ family response regulator